MESACADKLAVVVPTPKAKLQKLQKTVSENPSGLPIGGWHYVICLQDAEGTLKPCSIQGNAMKPDEATQKEKSCAVAIMQKYDKAERDQDFDQAQGLRSDDSEESHFQGRKESPPKQFRDNRLPPAILDYCERFQNCQGIPKENIETVTAGLTLFGMKQPHDVDISAMLSSWENMRRKQERMRWYYGRILSANASSSPDTLQKLAQREQQLSSLGLAPKFQTPDLQAGFGRQNGWI